ncbi:MAG: Stp1/IreP family PP2C-type Ser/Thr phosphatase [Bacilli bacterium]|nr:Stp1/IreP family PP2C-type Ser/Thr phosphatase [Bacilli bacterium]
MKTFYLTDTGKVRSHNEDNVVIYKNENNEFMMAVADGMGGHKAGEIASFIATNKLTTEFLKKDHVGDKESAEAWIKQMYTEINDEIFEYTDEHPESKGMGTTLVMCLFTKDYLLFANIGDSSGFVTKENKLFKVTKDHTLTNLLINTGDLTEEEAKNHPQKNIIMKALGAINPVRPDLFYVEDEVDSILMCSDGLTTMLNIEQIEKVLNSDLTMEEKVMRLIKRSNNRGGTDNISVAYLVKEDGDLCDSKRSKDK